MSNVLFIFLDGVGIGENDPKKNPFVSGKINFLEKIFSETPVVGNCRLVNSNTFCFPVDSLLGINNDIPQSGTGQTTIFCGINAAKILGKHFGPFPHSELIPYLSEHSIYSSLIKMNKKVCFANAYPPVFFKYLESAKKRTSVSTMTARLNNIKINSIEEVRNFSALTAEITNHRWQRLLKLDLPIITIDRAVETLLKIAEENDFTFYEYFLTDHFGHGRNLDEMDENLEILSEFLVKIIEANKNLTILITSDHGNLEDISTKSHTLNPAIGISAGINSKYLSEKIHSLIDIKKVLIEVILSEQISSN